MRMVTLDGDDVRGSGFIIIANPLESHEDASPTDKKIPAKALGLGICRLLSELLARAALRGHVYLLPPSTEQQQNMGIPTDVSKDAGRLI